MAVFGTGGVYSQQPSEPGADIANVEPSDPEIEAGNGDPLRLRNLHKQPYFFDVVFGSVAGWVLGMIKGFNSTADWLRRYIRKEPPRYLILGLDFIVFVAMGGYIGTGIYDPDTFVEALAAGSTWPVAFGALATKEQE